MTKWKLGSEATGLSISDESTPPVGVTVEALRRFVTYAEFKRIFDVLDSEIRKKDVHSLSILSLYPEEGKTFILGALAVGFTEMMGLRVLIVDAANPASKWTVEDVFKVPTERDPQMEAVVTAWGPSLDGIQLSTFKSVAYKAQEYRVQDLISEYKNKYDLILFDCAALKATNRGNYDPWVIANRTDASVLVMGSKQNELQQASPQDPLMRLRIMGVIENGGLA